MAQKKILVVCLGNICRSPIAEGIFQKHIDERDLPWIVDSAGTSGWHDGETPDSRSIQVCKKYGIDISRQTSRKMKQNDFEEFDYIIAMDDENKKNLLNIAPADKVSKILRMMDFLPDRKNEIVPDPYFDNRFQEVYDILEKAVASAVVQFESEKTHE